MSAIFFFFIIIIIIFGTILNEFIDLHDLILKTDSFKRVTSYGKQIILVISGDQATWVNRWF